MAFADKFKNCPSTDQIRSFLDQASDVPQFDTELAEHFIYCQDCFDQLNELSGGSSGFFKHYDDTVVQEAAPELQTTPAIIWDAFRNTWPVQAGFRIGTYEVIRKIDDGGMGEVFEARDIRLNRRVAIKTIVKEKLSPQTLVRLNQEAQILATLKHPNIVAILELGEWRGLPFLAMEYVEGETLSARIRKATLPPIKAARLLEAIARAIHYTHERGVLHRDLKPSNIIIEETPIAADDSNATDLTGSITAPMVEWQPKIIDFGLSKWVQFESRISQTGNILGTPLYMSPEQVDSTQVIGPTADIYAMGVILYECLVGQTPFKGESMEATIQKIREMEPLSPRAINPLVPRDLVVICLKCLRKDPSKRYQSALELAADLERFIGGRPILARPVRLHEKTWRWTRRNRPLAAALALCIFLLGGLVAGAVLFGIRQNGLRQFAEAQRQKFELQKLKAEFDRNKVTELYVNQLEMLNHNILDLAVKEVADLKSPQVEAVQKRSIEFLKEMQVQYAALENEDLHLTFPKLQFDMLYHLGMLHKKMGDWPSMAKAFQELLEVSKTVNLPGSLPIVLKMSAANDIAIYLATSKQEAKAESLWHATWEEWKTLDKAEFRKDPRLLQNLDSITANLAMFLNQQNKKPKADQILEQFKTLKKAVESN